MARPDLNWCNSHCGAPLPEGALGAGPVNILVGLGAGVDHDYFGFGGGPCGVGGVGGLHRLHPGVFDVPGVEAAGYVALSRVQHDRDWQFVGDPGVHHFTPATGC